jgi:hypothetical protein
MPKATASKQGQRFDLKELPEGYVVLRKLDYGEMLSRRNLGMGVTAPFKRDSDSIDMKLDLSQEEVRVYEFSHMIIDHNLEDDAGRKLNMLDRSDINKLDPKVALEIEKYISELNLPDDETPLPAQFGSQSDTENGSKTQT